MWRGLPINCAADWNAEYYFGTKQASVWLYDGTLDGTTIDGDDLWVDDTQDVGVGWTEPSPLVYACDGTQLDTTELTIETGVPAVIDLIYEVTYTVVGSSGGKHAIRYGSATSISEFLEGDGTFRVQFRSDGVESIAAVVGDVDFIGTIAGVILFSAAVLGNSIEFETLTSFQAPNGDHANQKRVGFIRTIGYLAGTAALNVKAVYDYELETILAAPATNPTQGINVWDGGIWDRDLWDYGSEGVSFPVGSLGMGRVVAIGIRGSSSTRLNFVGWDVSYTVGGFL